jgi:histone H1/5
LLASTGAGCRVGWQQPSTGPAPQRTRTVKPAARAKPIAKAKPTAKTKPVAKTKPATKKSTERKSPTSRKPAAKRARVPQPKRRSAAPTRRKRGN